MQPGRVVSRAVAASSVPPIGRPTLPTAVRHAPPECSLAVCWAVAASTVALPRLQEAQTWYYGCCLHARPACRAASEPSELPPAALCGHVARPPSSWLAACPAAPPLQSIFADEAATQVATQQSQGEGDVLEPFQMNG